MGLFDLFKSKKREYAFSDPKISAAAAEKALEVRKSLHEIKLLELETVKLKHQRDQLALQQEIALNSQEQEQPKDQMQELMQMYMFFQSLVAKKAEGQSFDDMSNFMAQLNPGFGVETNSRMGESSSARSNSPPSASELGQTDDEIREQIRLLPPDKVALAKRLPSKMVKNYIKKNTDYDDKTIDRAIQIIKTEM